MTNAYCEALGIPVPTLEVVKDHRSANNYTLLIVALLECGAPMTLAEVAERFEAAGIVPAGWALMSLKRSKPGRRPVYREGEFYCLDLLDQELTLLTYRLGLHLAKARRTVVPATPQPLPGPETVLSVREIDEAWREADLGSWSVQRLALAILDAGDGPMHPEEVVAFVDARTCQHRLGTDPVGFKRRDSAIEVLSDGRWAIVPGHSAIESARKAVRARLEVVRRRVTFRPDPARLEKARRARERERAERGAELARLRRVIVHGFPAKSPEALVLLDVTDHRLETFLGAELDAAKKRLAAFEVIAALDVRRMLRAVGFEIGARRLDELGPPQKTKRLNKSGRTLKISTKLLIQGSCGIGRPFGDQEKLREYFRDGKESKLRRRLEADAKSLLALYEFGRLHGALRLRWGFLDEWISVPWVTFDAPTLGLLKQQAHELGVPLEVVVGSAPDWKDPWSRGRNVVVEVEETGWRSWLVDDDGLMIDEAEVQRARLVTKSH
jgi:hypothetical protein